jgi:ribosomal protein L35AE/L33A
MFPNRRDLGQLVGKRVVFRIRNKAFRGKVIALFGRKGRIVLCRFRKGLPSDVVGKEIEVL